MKKLLLAIISGGLLALIIPATSMAASGYTDITGVVSYNGVHVGKGVKVTVKCKNNTLNTLTDKTGSYFVQFTKGQCPVNASISVTTKVNGVKTTVTGKATKDSNKLNVAVINVSVPEFGAVTAIGGTLVGGGAFAVMRRRHLRGQATA